MPPQRERWCHGPAWGRDRGGIDAALVHGRVWDGQRIRLGHHIGAGLLFLTNLAAIVASAFLVFYVVRMDSPDVRTKIDSLVLEGASHDRLYAVLQRTRLSEAFGHVGKLRWRIVMLVAILAILFVPLRRSLLQVRDEASSRAAVREALRLLGPADSFVTQQVDITPAQIVIRVFASAPVPKSRIGEAERYLLRRTGKEVSLTVRKVASEEELALLRQQMRTPAPVRRRRRTWNRSGRRW